MTLAPPAPEPPAKARRRVPADVGQPAPEPAVVTTTPTTSEPEASWHVPRQLARPVVWERGRRLDFRHVAGGLALAGLAVWATRRAWLDAWSLVDVNGDNSHVFLAPLVVAWLLWVRRGRLAHLRVKGRWAGPTLVGLGWATAAVGLANNYAAALHLGSLMVVVGAFVSVVGKAILLRLMPVCFALLFLIPVPQVIRQQLAGPVQAWTATVADGLLDLAGVESRVAGSTIVVDGEAVMIAEACNGMPMMFGLLLVTYAFAFAWPLRNGVRWLLLISAPLVTLACNVLRTTPLVWAYAHHGRRVGDALHAWSGWLMLPLAFVVLLGLLKALRWFDVPVERYRLAAR